MTDIDALIRQIEARIAQRKPKKPKAPQKRRRLKVVPLEDAIKRLNGDDVWRKAGKGFRWEKDD